MDHLLRDIRGVLAARHAVNRANDERANIATQAEFFAHRRGAAAESEAEFAVI